MREGKDYKTFFMGKKITMLGLGLLGRGVNVAKFLIESGAELLITDLKSEDALTRSIQQLKKHKDTGSVRYVLGEHRLSDFKNCDMIIKAAGVSFDSPYVAEANKNHIPVEMDASLFAQFSEVTTVGVTGTRGKTTTTYLIHHILKQAGRKVFLGGNVRGIATLSLLKKVRKGDIVALELDSWQLQGFGDAKISPHISVFTNFFPDHLNYYRGSIDRYFRDKANIFRYQKKGEIVIAGEQAAKEIKIRFKGVMKSDIRIARKNIVPQSWKIKIIGEHNRANIACAIVACRSLAVSEKDIKRGVETFFGVPGRLDAVRTVRGVRYVNDTTSTTPEGNRAALVALAKKGKRTISLIAGGADKELNYVDMARIIHKTVKGLVLIQGTATEKILVNLPKRRIYPVSVVSSMKEAVSAARACARRGDTVLLSPGAASFGVFKNEFDRGDQFVVLVKKLS
jgi:UDP-N-acetylmuramoylalanine--D-glutamate ligase